MFKKNLLLLCALVAAYAPMKAVDLDDAVTKKNKCCKCCSLTVTGNGSIGGSLNIGGSETVGGNLNVTGSETVGGNLTVTGSVTASSFSTPTSGLLFNGLRNWAVFSNHAAVTSGNIVLWDTTPINTPAITNTVGDITLPIGGTFLVMYTVRFAVAAGASGSAFAQLQQTVASVFAPITQAAVVGTAATLPTGTDINSQVTGYAIVTTTNATNNQINLLIALDPNFTVPPTIALDSNAQLTILQLN